MPPDFVSVVDDQHPDDPFQFDRRPTFVAVEWPQFPAYPVHVEGQVDLSRQVIGRKVLIQGELLDELDHGLLPPIVARSSGQNESNETSALPTATKSISTGSAAIQPFVSISTYCGFKAKRFWI